MKIYAKFTTEELINLSKNLLIKKCKNMVRETHKLNLNLDIISIITDATKITKSSLCEILKDTYKFYDKNKALFVKNAIEAINEILERLIKRDNNLKDFTLNSTNYIDKIYKYENIYDDLQNDICSSKLMCMKKYLKKIDALIDAYTEIKKETSSLNTRDIFWQKTFKLIEFAEHRMGITKFKKQIQIRLKKIN